MLTSSSANGNSKSRSFFATFGTSSILWSIWVFRTNNVARTVCSSSEIAQLKRLFQPISNSSLHNSNESHNSCSHNSSITIERSKVYSFRSKFSKFFEPTVELPAVVQSRRTATIDSMKKPKMSKIVRHRMYHKNVSLVTLTSPFSFSFWKIFF